MDLFRRGKHLRFYAAKNCLLEIVVQCVGAQVIQPPYFPRVCALFNIIFFLSLQLMVCLVACNPLLNHCSPWRFRLETAAPIHQPNIGYNRLQPVMEFKVDS